MIGNLLFYKSLFVGFILCFIFDNISKKLIFISNKKITSQNYRWFFIHCIFNLMITIFGLNDLMLCININECATQPWINGDIIYGLALSLHMYHSLFFDLTNTDIIHHLSTAFLSTPLVITYHRYPTAVVGAWFLTGLPGFIDYFLLWLVKMNVINPIIEKRIYVWINVWIRAPGCVAACVLQLGMLNIIDKMSWIQIFAISWNALVTYLNGLYFMNDTLSKYYSKYNLKI